MDWRHGLSRRLAQLAADKGATINPRGGLEAQLAGLEAHVGIAEPPATWGRGLEPRLALIDATALPFAGLTNYWRLEESPPGPWVDVVGAKSLAYHPSFPVPTQVAGKENFGLRMPAGSISLIRSTPVSFDWSGPHSMAWWFKPDGPQGGVFFDNRGAGANGYYFGWSLNPFPTYDDDLFTLQIEGGAYYPGTTPCPEGLWHHLVIASNGIDETRVYVNGALEITAPVTPNQPGNELGELWLYNGSHDELGLFFGTVIEQPQVSALYAAGAGVFY